MVSLLDEPILDGIGQGVDHFLDDVGGVDEADDAGLLGRPEVLPSAAQRVLALGEELVKVLEESPRRSRSLPLPVSIDDPRTGRTGDPTSREIRPTLIFRLAFRRVCSGEPKANLLPHD